MKYYGHLDAFREFETRHQAVHKTGHQMIQLHNEGKKEEAILLTETLMTLKSKILESLNVLQQQVAFLN